MSTPAPISWNDVLTLPGTAKLASVDPFWQESVLSYVNAVVGIPIVFDGESGPKTRLARIYLAAHMGTKMPQFGAVSSESAGGLSRSYAVPPVTNDGLGTTVWGREYLGLVNRSIARLPVVG